MDSGSFSSTKMIASDGQLRSQVPHSTHIVTSMYACVSPSVMALLSQPAEQAPHNMHASVTL
jgi:hypothetical protein